MRHLTRISRFSLSVAWLQPQISAIEREQPRQTLFSSRQQLRTHGEATSSIDSLVSLAIRADSSAGSTTTRFDAFLAQPVIGVSTHGLRIIEGVFGSEVGGFSTFHGVALRSAG